MAFDFTGRVALITGAGRGLGRAYALDLASRGCAVVINDLGVSMSSGGASGQVAQEVVDEIAAAGGKAAADAHNVVTDAVKIVGTAIDAFGRLDIVINNAGSLTGTSFAETSADVWHTLFDVHLRGTVEVCRAAWPHLAASDAGRIVNTASSALYGNSWMTAYGGAKGGIAGFSRSLGVEAKETSINVNCIFPTAWTRMSEALTDPEIRRVFKGEFGPERVAAFVTWLVAPETQVNGEMFMVGGGQAARFEFAHDAFVKSAADDPAAWAKVADGLFAKGSLQPLRSTFDSLITELKSVDPTIKLEAGGDLRKVET